MGEEETLCSWQVTLLILSHSAQYGGDGKQYLKYSFPPLSRSQTLTKQPQTPTPQCREGRM